MFPCSAAALLATLAVGCTGITHAESSIVFLKHEWLSPQKNKLERRIGLSHDAGGSIASSRHDVGTPPTFKRPRTLITKLQAKVSRTIPPNPNSNFVRFLSKESKSSSDVNPEPVASELFNSFAFREHAKDSVEVESGRFVPSFGPGGSRFRFHSRLKNSRELKPSSAIDFSSPIIIPENSNLIDLDSIFPIPSTKPSSSRAASSFRSGLENGRQISTRGIKEDFLSVFGTRPVVNSHSQRVDPKLSSFPDARALSPDAFYAPQNSQLAASSFTFTRGRNSRGVRTSLLEPEDTNHISHIPFELHATNRPSRLRSSLQATLAVHESTSSPFENHNVENIHIKPSAFQHQIVRQPDFKHAEGPDHSSNFHIRLSSSDHRAPHVTLSSPRHHSPGPSHSHQTVNTKSYPLLRGNFVGSRTFVG